eukprot:1364113-Alexandrium_andersonii.AAC.1
MSGVVLCLYYKISGVLEFWIYGFMDFGISGLHDYGISGFRDFGIAGFLASPVNSFKQVLTDTKGLRELWIGEFRTGACGFAT